MLLGARRLIDCLLVERDLEKSTGVLSLLILLRVLLIFLKRLRGLSCVCAVFC
jgi:hypothetical protein